MMLPPPPSFTPDTPTPTATGAYSIAAIANQRNYSVAAPSRVSGWEVVQAADPSTIPCRRSLHAAAVWKDNFIVFGGYDGARRVNDLHSFHFPTNDWRQLNQVNAPSPRDRHIAVVYDDSLYIFGGFDGESRVNDLHAYNLETNSWRSVTATAGVAPTPRHSHAAVVFQDSMYVFGGYDGSYRSDFHAFHFPSGVWRQVLGAGDVPRARYRGTCVVCPSSAAMILHGGHDGTRHLQDTHLFDFFAQTWILLATEGPIPSPRDSHVSVLYGNAMYLYGGSTGAAMGDFHELKLEFRRMWSPVIVSVSGNATTSTTTASATTATSHFNHNNSNAQTTPSTPAARTGSQSQTAAATVVSAVSTPVPTSTTNELHLQRQQSQPQGTMLAEQEVDGDATETVSLSPGARFCHVGVVYDQAFYIFGGYDGQNRLNDFLRFPFQQLEYTFGGPYASSMAPMYNNPYSHLMSMEGAGSLFPNLGSPLCGMGLSSGGNLSSNNLAASSSLLRDLRQYVNCDLLSDVQFVVEGQTIYAHKILCLRCPYFRNMLMGEYMESRAESIAIPDVKHSTFLLLLEYLYTDAVNITVETAMELFQVADRFAIDRLKELCEQKMLSTIEVDTAGHILLTADQHNAQNLREKCMTYVLRHFDRVSVTPAFEEMGRTNVDLVFEVLRRRQKM